VKHLVLLSLIFLGACAGTRSQGSPKEGKAVFNYHDVSGSFRLSREHKVIGKNLVTRSQLMSSEGNGNKLLEKTIAVAQMGSIKNKKKRLIVVRPKASEFSVWLEGKKYFSKLTINPAKKSMSVSYDSPEKGKGSETVPFPRGKYFCFFSQLQDCLFQNQLLIQSSETRNQRFAFYVLWESYPFTQEQFSGVGKTLFSSASVKFDGEDKKYFRYIIEVEGQIILYHFSKNFDFVKMAWISQGITVVPPDQDVTSDSEE
jgi:hypothetical protein